MRPHRLGRGCDEARGFAAGEAALRHLSHADHGRRHHPHHREDIFQYIGHFHTGGVPGRHELDDTQELQWRTIAKAIADLNFQGYFAHEFIPVKDPMASLRQAVELCTV